MPAKPYKDVELPRLQPDCCNECPLLGLIPKHRRKPKSQETLVCLATGEALSARLARARASTKDAKHKLKRYCDDDWDRWQEDPYYGKLPVRKIDLSIYRDPWVRSRELTIIFHEKRGPKPKCKDGGKE